MARSGIPRHARPDGEERPPEQGPTRERAVIMSKPLIKTAINTMNKTKPRGLHRRVLSWAILLLGGPAFAQVDIAGVWAYIGGQYGQENGGGSELADYTGIPINEEGRSVGLSFSAAMWSEPNRQCQFYSPRYVSTGPFAMTIWSESDPVSGRPVSWNMNAWIDKDVVTIWMDGRPHPSANAFHPFGGFTTGTWEGDTLVTRTTHMKWSYLRINGLQHSDRATLTQYIVRHGNLLSIMAYFEDPVYLTEPFVLTSVWVLNPKANGPRFPPACEPINESPRLENTATVPHYLPGKNPFANDYAKYYNLPVEAAQGGAETMYPEFRKHLKNYVPPAKCVRYCCDTRDPAVKCIRDGTGIVK
jgi:hypothetical protein